MKTAPQPAHAPCPKSTNKRKDRRKGPELHPITIKRRAALEANGFSWGEEAVSVALERSVGNKQLMALAKAAENDDADQPKKKRTLAEYMAPVKSPPRFMCSNPGCTFGADWVDEMRHHQVLCGGGSGSGGPGSPSGPSGVLGGGGASVPGDVSGGIDGGAGGAGGGGGGAGNAALGSLLAAAGALEQVLGTTSLSCLALFVAQCPHSKPSRVSVAMSTNAPSGALFEDKIHLPHVTSLCPEIEC